jgi:hypothetical protein
MISENNTEERKLMLDGDNWNSSPPTDADLQKYRSQGTRLLVEVSYYLGPFVARVCAFSPNREVVALLPDCDYAKAIWVKAARSSVFSM